MQLNQYYRIIFWPFSNFLEAFLLHLNSYDLIDFVSNLKLFFIRIRLWFFSELLWCNYSKGCSQIWSGGEIFYYKWSLFLFLLFSKKQYRKCLWPILLLFCSKPNLWRLYFFLPVIFSKPFPASLFNHIYNYQALFCISFCFSYLLNY